MKIIVSFLFGAVLAFLAAMYVSMLHFEYYLADIVSKLPLRVPLAFESSREEYIVFLNYVNDKVEENFPEYISSYDEMIYLHRKGLYDREDSSYIIGLVLSGLEKNFDGEGARKKEEGSN